jgi:hypothetical protein
MALLQKENIERVEQSRITLLLAGECYVKNLLIFLFVRWDSNSFNDCHVKCRLCLFASGSIVGDVCLHSSYNNQNQTGLNILGGGRVRDTKNVHFITNLLQLLFTHYSMNNNTHFVIMLIKFDKQSIHLQLFFSLISSTIRLVADLLLN